MSMPAPRKKERRAKCVFDYAPTQDDELALKTGDIVHNVKDSVEGWCEDELELKVRGGGGLGPSCF